MLEDVKVPIRLRLSALWAALMFCYVYGDYFGLYHPGQLQGMLHGEGPIGPTSQVTLVAVSVLMAIPSLMVFLPMVLPSVANRWMNILLGLLYAAAPTHMVAWFILLAMQGLVPVALVHLGERSLDGVEPDHLGNEPLQR